MPNKIIIIGRWPMAGSMQAGLVGTISQFIEAPHIIAIVLRLNTGIEKWVKLAAMLVREGRKTGKA